MTGPRSSNKLTLQSRDSNLSLPDPYLTRYLLLAVSDLHILRYAWSLEPTGHKSLYEGEFPPDPWKGIKEHKQFYWKHHPHAYCLNCPNTMKIPCTQTAYMTEFQWEWNGSRRPAWFSQRWGEASSTLDWKGRKPFFAAMFNGFSNINAGFWIFPRLLTNSARVSWTLSKG